MILDFVKHFFSSFPITKVDEPILIDFYQNVLKGKNSEIGKDINLLRKQLAQSQQSIQFRDFGAKGGTDSAIRETTIGAIARSATRRRREGEFLHRLCKYYQPQRCLELGTNLGISTLYQITALENSQFITLEGAQPILQLAEQHFTQFDQKITTILGEFSNSLENLNLHTLKPDYVFIDGNHRLEPTLKYFYKILPHIEDEGLIIFDDIYWSKGMKKAWNDIIKHEDVSISIDLFFFGLCFIRYSQKKQHFVFRLI